MYTVDILIRSYDKDFRWLTYALRSILLRAKGFRKTHIIVPQGQAEQLKHLTLEKVHECSIYSDDYLGQQITKLMADTYTDADYIMHIDSDTVFFRDVSPETFIINGKPIIYYEPYETVGVLPWKPIVTEVLGWAPIYEFMRRFPFIYPRWLYAELRNFIENKHSMSLESYITRRPYRSFSEFNTLGEYAWRKHNSDFTWRNPHEDQVYIKQFRSWDGISQYLDELNDLTR